ncbi:tRNA (adenosine(37)-N6)-dimethylallyltransferase MiaA [Buchnera aphidicola]|uniref:tRNA (adenosine(37)-N6)-dimethylallyltransferase MiaA n=1 Tax=Buchnera aphidicola TaxID=9 RepID=UPI00346390AA
MGPTACGKSKFAINLRSYLPIELISVDSALIYRDMNIGTSKPNDSDLLKHPHHLLNIKDPIESYSVAEFQKDVLKIIIKIIQSGKIPCLVGGTMFYYQALLYGLSALPKSNQKIREHILHIVKNKDCLHKQLKLIDPISAVRIHHNDIQRLLRALEVFFITGKTITELTQNNSYILPYTVLQFALMPPSKEWLYKQINFRLDQMLFTGFQKEVELLFYRGDLHIKLQSIRCIGYRQMWQYLEYKISHQEMVYEIIRSTRKLAKHQLTWLKKWKNIYILDNQNFDLSIKKFLNIFNKKIIKCYS